METMEVIKTKRCSGCRITKPLGAFGKRTASKDGLRFRCRGCRAQANKKYQATEKGQEVQRRGTKKYRKKNRDKILCQRKEYYVKNRGKILQQVKNYRDTVNGYLRRVFSHIKGRCSNPTVQNYSRYGGRGIQNKFKCVDEFIKYVTDELQIDPRGKHIHRKDNDGHYERGNIEFLTPEEHRAVHKSLQDNSL